MTIKEAIEIIEMFDFTTIYSEENYKEVMDAYLYIIQETNESKYMLSLGGIYYEQQMFDLALKYYEMAADLEDVRAYECLGYIYYYGRCGKKDYEKAFKYYSKAMELGNVVSTYKLADMYKNGYYVNKDYEKYVSIIKSLYDDTLAFRYLYEPLPEIYTRLANIYIKEDNIIEAKRLLLEAKNFLTERMHYGTFFGNFTIMKYLIKDLYSIIDLDLNNLTFFDLYEILNKPCTVKFECDFDDYEIEVVDEDGLKIKFLNQSFNTIDDFMMHAQLDEMLLAQRAEEMENIKVEY